MSGPTQDELKWQAATRALDFVAHGMKLGLGTGSTAKAFVTQLATRVRDGLDVVCVPTSEATRAQAEASGLRLATLDELPALDLTVDGADEFDPELRLIKGGGGALLREKIVAAASASMVVITDRSKQVARLGRFPLPVEVNPFGLGATLRLMGEVARKLQLPAEFVQRQAKAGNGPFVTDGGHFIIDCHFGAIADPERLAAELFDIPGVVEHGLFLGLATAVIIADPAGTRVIQASENKKL
jgi:ribose 5-phosphate isomerase A